MKRISVIDSIFLFALQGLQNDEELRKVQEENKARYIPHLFLSLILYIFQLPIYV